ncbi:MAG: hypothetical protein ABSE16_13395 [Verrucomicrobiota bacterium]
MRAARVSAPMSHFPANCLAICLPESKRLKLGFQADDFPVEILAGVAVPARFSVGVFGCPKTPLPKHCIRLATRRQHARIHLAPVDRLEIGKGNIKLPIRPSGVFAGSAAVNRFQGVAVFVFRQARFALRAFKQNLL